MLPSIQTPFGMRMLTAMDLGILPFRKPCALRLKDTSRIIQIATITILRRMPLQHGIWMETGTATVISRLPYRIAVSLQVMFPTILIATMLLRQSTPLLWRYTTALMTIATIRLMKVLPRLIIIWTTTVTEWVGTPLS